MAFNRIHVFAFFVFLVISLLSLRSFFATSDPVAFHDLAPMYRLDQLSLPYDFPWDYKSNLGSPSMVNGNTIYNIPLIGLSMVFGSVAFAHKVMLVLFMAFCGFGFYLAFNYLFRSKMAGFIVGLCLMFNPFTLERWMYGHNTILLAIAILPFAILCFFKVTREGGRKFLVACGLLTALLIATEPHTAYMFIFFMLLYMVIDFAASTRNGVLTRIKFRVAQIGIIIGVALVGAFPIFYQLAMVDLTVYSVRAEEAVVSSADVTASALPQIALIAFIGLVTVYLWKKREPTQTSPTTSFIQMNRRKIFFFAALGLVSVLLFFLAAEPLTPIYSWLFNNIPGFSMFREVNKWSLLSSLSVAFFLGLAAELLKLRMSQKGFSIAAKALPILLISIIILAPSWQFVTGDIGGNVGTAAIPEDYKALESWLSSQNGNFRIALFPPAVWATTYSWAPRWFLDPMVALQNKPTVELKSEFDLTASASLSRWVFSSLYSNRTNDWGRILGLLGVKYLVLRTDADIPSDRIDLRAFSLANTFASWGNQSDLQLEQTFGSFLVYKNHYQLPHIYDADGLSLIVGDRRSLISLNSLGFDFGKNPAAFLDDNLGLFRSLVKASHHVVSQGDPYWSLLVSSLGESVVVKPWLYTPVSANPWNKWVSGDLMWWLWGGDLNVPADGFIYTEAAADITVPLNVGASGNYIILAQVYDGVLSGSKGLRFTTDGAGAVDYTFTPTRPSEGSYMWIEIGRARLGSQNMLHISNLGGGAAVSKVAVIPANAVDQAEKNVSKLLQESAANMTYLFDDYSWNYNPTALVVNPAASNGRLINLSESSASTSFFAFKDDTFTMRLSFQSSGADASVRVYVDDTAKDVEITGGTSSSSTQVDLGPLNLKAGNHSITIEAKEGEARLDLAALSVSFDAFNASSTGYDDAAVPNYTMLSGSEYKIDDAANNLVFLEGGSGYWRLSDQDGKVAIPITVFNYGSMFQLGDVKSPRTLTYLGLRYLEQGFAVTFIALALIGLTLKFLGPKRFVFREIIE